MSTTNKTYIGLALALALSLALPYLLPPNYFVNFVATLGATIALGGGIFQLLRDQMIHERALLIIEANNRFSLGASSHMANTAFDKHVLFCEEYVAEVQKTLSTLYRDGPRDSALAHAHALYNIQEKYRVWLTRDIEQNLEQFEKVLREIGAGAGYIEAVRGSGNPDEDAVRAKTIKRIYQEFAKVIGLPEWQGEKLTEESTTSVIIQKLRDVLGISELTSLRKAIMAKAIQ